MTVSAIDAETPRSTSVDVLAVGPHLDDNVLTWGVTMMKAARSRRVASLTVFAGEPQSLTSAGQERNERLGMKGVDDRQREDAEASGILSPHIELVHWPYHAATLRWEGSQPRVVESKDKYSAFTAADRSLIDEFTDCLRAVIVQRRPKVILGITGVAPHVDHRMVADATQRAVQELAAEHGLGNMPILLLAADLPYAFGKDVDDRLTTLFGTSDDMQVIHASEDDYDKKLNAISQFTTQRSEFEKYLGDWHEKFRQHGRRFGTDQSPYGEPYWRAPVGDRDFDIKEYLSGVDRPHTR